MSAVATAAPLLVYFSSVSGNTARFIEKLGLPARRIPSTGTKRTSSSTSPSSWSPHLRRGCRARVEKGPCPSR